MTHCLSLPSEGFESSTPEEEHAGAVEFPCPSNSLASAFNERYRPTEGLHDDDK